MERTEAGELDSHEKTQEKKKERDKISEWTDQMVQKYKDN